MKKQAVIAGLIVSLVAARSAPADALWDAPSGAAALEEVTPTFDREAGARRRLNNPNAIESVPSAAALAAAKMWYAPLPSPQIERKGRVLDVAGMRGMEGLEATPVSVNVKGVAPDAALEALGQAMGMNVRTQSANLFQRTGPREVTLSLEKAPALEALLELCSQTATSVNEMTAKRITLARQTENETWGAPSTRTGGSSGMGVGTWCVAGPFAVVIERLERIVDLKGGDNETAQMTVMLIAEPKVQVAQYPQKLNIETAVDDLDQPITFTEREDRRGRGVIRPSQSGAVRRITLTMNLPKHAGQKFIVLKGSAPFMLMVNPVTVEMEGKSTQTVGKNVAGMRVEIDPVKHARAATYMLTVRYLRNDMDAEKWEQVVNVLPDIAPVMTNVSGLPLNSLNRTSRRVGSDLVEVTGTYADSGQGAAAGMPEKVVVVVPGEAREVRAPFEFRDIVLP